MTSLNQLLNIDTISILLWNTAGRNAKSNDTSFIKYPSTFDIVLLQEIWALGEVEVSGYSAHQISATPNEKRGRAKGSLLILVSTKLHITMIKFPSLNQHAAAIEVKINHSTIVFINVYLPLQRLNAETDRIHQDLETYIQNILLTRGDSEVIIGGDFNSRMGTNDLALYAAHNCCPPKTD